MHVGAVSNCAVISTHWLIEHGEGGNDVLPPGWFQYQLEDATQYQDDSLHIVSIHRPSPGVRLGELKSATMNEALTTEHR
jgi:hypothetical protein